MRLYPAIDIKGGRVVRWLEGEATRETVYHGDPLDHARGFIRDGADWLHVVDMDRAFGTGDDNSEWVRELAALPEVDVQVGGDVADPEWAGEAVSVGASRVVLGTKGLLDAGLFTELVRATGANRCAVALDARAGNLALRGRRGPVGLSIEAAVQRALESGVRTVVYRDLERDGLVLGADIAGACKVGSMGVDVVVAGGVAGLRDIHSAAKSGLAGVIVGRALHEGRFTLREALACLQ
jgi:phosphoribosylformimino-5-aminoimidazole carboxamide ribotide isomerase